jgi:AbrB family looped-hinge helix DNA binding protein
MTSTVTTKGQTVVPKEVRTRFEIEPGTTLDWQPEGDSIRVVKLVPAKSGGAGLNWLRRLGRIPAARRDHRPVEAR